MKKLILTFTFLIFYFSIAYTQTAEEYNEKGLNQLDSNNNDEAIILFTKAISKIPDNIIYYLNRGMVYNKIEKYFNALADCDKIISINPNYEKAYYSRGMVFTNIQLYSVAFSDFTKAIALNPGFTEAYVRRGILYCHLGSDIKALAEYDKAIEIDPFNEDANYNRDMIFKRKKSLYSATADSYKIHNKDLPECDNEISGYNKLIELNPTDAFAYYFRGFIFYDFGFKDKACEDWKTAYSFGINMPKHLKNNDCR